MSRACRCGHASRRHSAINPSGVAGNINKSCNVGELIAKTAHKLFG